MTDVPDDPSGLPPERGAPRRPRVGDSGSPVGSTLSIILAVVAVVAGFLILRAITDDDSSAGDSGEIDAGTGTTAPDEDIDVGPVTVVSTSVAGTAPAGPVYTGATIVVANSSGISGSAAAMSTALQTQGYQGVGEPANGTGEDITATIIYYAAADTAAQAVAQSIATDLGGVQTAELPVPPPAEGGGVAGATVLVLLGTDAAGKTIAELSAGAATATGAAAGGTTVVPPPAIITRPTTD